MTKILLISVKKDVVINTIHEVIEVCESDTDFIFDCEYSAILISSWDESTFKHWLNKTRSDNTNFLSLIYTSIEQFSDLNMVDGLMPSNIDEIIDRHLVRKKELILKTNANLENRMLSYLWMKNGRHLSPDRIINEGVNYVYPFLELWDQEYGKDLWLKRMVKSGYLIQDKLVNRIRQCASCQSSLLNYVDTCNNCTSIDLRIEQALHCFSCGHVGDQQKFIRSGEMVCPNCLNTLRHIGTDYDRPIENQRCNNCDNLFIDAKVSAQCFCCGENNEIDDLVQKEYFSFVLGHNGIHKIKTGSDLQLLATSVGEPVTREHFSWMLNWSNQMAVRQSSNHLFIGLKFVNLFELTRSISTISLTSQIEAFSERLRKLLRTTDIFCQYSDDILFFLLPGVSKKSLKTIEEKLSKISLEQQDNQLELKVSLHILPDHELTNDALFWLTERSHELNS